MTAQPAPGGAAPLIAEADALRSARPASLWRDTLSGILRQRSAIVGIVILGIYLFIVIFADQIAPFDPRVSMLGLEENARKQAAPCIHLLGCAANLPEHIFGLDTNFQDVFSRVVIGARISLGIGFAAIGMAIVIGGAIGAVAGYTGGKTDNILMRFMDVLLAFPSLLLAIAIVSALGSSLLNTMLAIGIVSIPVYARIVRSSVLGAKENDYVVASRALGESTAGILVRRVMPNAVTPLIVQGTLGIGTAVLEIAALAFVGVVSLSEITWGSMISIEFQRLFTAPHIILAPGLAITFAVLGFNLLGDGLRDAFDPRLNR
jgi:ABC-type dipeptide/oligopeptide/nickel transport system permease subunit